MVSPVWAATSKSAQAQLESELHCGERQTPPVQVRPDWQLRLVSQLWLQEAVVDGVGVGVAVGLLEQPVGKAAVFEDEG